MTAPPVRGNGALHVHLDVHGGISGDMFLASVLDARPDLEQPLRDAIDTLRLPDAPAIERIATFDRGLRGSRVVVGVPAHEHHAHRPWAEIRRLIEGSGLAPAVIERAVAIFRLLASAEADVHGVDEAAVVFHEVGALDSIVDIVGAAFLIDAVGAASWSASPLPLGSGRVRAAHGMLPVPAPATTLLLAGFVTFDDGVPGERITPTGAAIVRHLGCTQGPRRQALRLVGSGTGFGTRTLPDMSNSLRTLLFEAPAVATPHRELAVFEFEVDDQTPEDLALGLDRLRTVSGVYDVLQIASHGKKGRITAHVQLIASMDLVESVANACFEETTTIGLRYRAVQSIALSRQMHDASIDGRALRTKVVVRPDGARTAKTDIEGVSSAGGHVARTAVRRRAERRALGDPEDDDA